MKNPLASYPGYLLRRAASSRLAQLGKHLEPFGLGIGEASILTLIHFNPDISQAECGRALSIQRTNLNPVMHRLIDRGLVIASKGPGRTQLLRLTAEGEALTSRVLVEFEAQEERIFAAVPAHLREELVPLLRSLIVE